MSNQANPGDKIGLTVGDVTRTQLYSLPETATIKQAAAELIRRDIECVIIERANGERAVLTELALLQALLPSTEELNSGERMPDELALEEIARDHANRTLSSIELRTIPTVAQSHPAMKALGQMLANNQRRLLVSDADGNVEGLVTQRDLLRSTLFNLYVSSDR
jgi:CBS domain-containing protein